MSDQRTERSGDRRLAKRTSGGTCPVLTHRSVPRPAGTHLCGSSEGGDPGTRSSALTRRNKPDPTWVGFLRSPFVIVAMSWLRSKIGVLHIFTCETGGIGLIPR